MSRFQRATREKLKLRMALDGPSGSGKTYSALRCAFCLGKRVAVIDTESRAASKYAGESPDGSPWDFDVINLKTYAPTEYTALIQEAGREGYDVIVIDSLSHAWIGEGGALEMKDQAGGNSFTAWAKITPMQRRMVDAILQSPCHVIATMRTKTEYVVERDPISGKSVPRKIGMAPLQRDGLEYEFDVYGSMDLSNILTVTKTRCPSLRAVIMPMPGPAFMRPLVEWLNVGVRTDIAMPSLASAKQIEDIHAVLRELGATEEYALSRIRELYGVASFEAMTEENAKDLASKMEAARLGKEQSAPEIPFEPQSSREIEATTKEAESENLQEEMWEKLSGQSNEKPQRISPDQLDRIDELLRVLKVDLPTATARLREKYGVEDFQVLSLGQAAEIILALETAAGEATAA